MFQLLKRKKTHAAMQSQKDATNSPERPMFAMICVNNVNRSTAAHDHLQAAGLRVCSYGAGKHVSVPGPTSTSPRVFDFFTPYELMYTRLKHENDELFTRNGVLRMLERDIATKKCPERWQSLSNKQLQQIDVAVCLDYRMFLTVLEGASLRFPSMSRLAVQIHGHGTRACSVSLCRLEHARSPELQKEMHALDLLGCGRHPRRSEKWWGVCALPVQRDRRCCYWCE